MSYQLDSVVPWGRSFDEYQAMFDLDGNDLRSSILGCGDGPASFNAEATHKGLNVVSIDPLYNYDAEAISQRIAEVLPVVSEQTRKNQDEFVWGTRFADPAHATQVRTAAMRAFIDDYPAGRAAGRYLPGRLPQLDLDDDSFDLAICSHYLFLYSEHVNLDEHVASILELRRVAVQVRIFPLLELGGAPSRHLNRVQSELRTAGYDSEIRSVDYEFQRNGNQMLVIQ